MGHKPIPLGNDCIVRPIDYDAKTKNGLLYVPEESKKNINNGIVIAKGPLVTDEIDIGDHILFSGYTGDKIVLSTGIYFVIPETHIACKLTQSTVKLVDTETMKKIIKDRMGELRMLNSTQIYYDTLRSIENCLIERINTLTAEEDYQS